MQLKVTLRGAEELLVHVAPNSDALKKFVEALIIDHGFWYNRKKVKPTEYETDYYQVWIPYHEVTSVTDYT